MVPALALAMVRPAPPVVSEASVSVPVPAPLLATSNVVVPPPLTVVAPRFRPYGKSVP